jgi:hypothetical protein
MQRHCASVLPYTSLLYLGVHLFSVLVVRHELTTVFYYYATLYNRDICDATDSENNEGWATLKAIFYYTCDPSGIEILFYCSYWVLTSVFIAFKLR